ncbi:type 1 fimbrial protein [Salmonella enterica]|nr:type 1 fimbrial protein [Salmonella enterica]
MIRKTFIAAATIAAVMGYSAAAAAAAAGDTSSPTATGKFGGGTIIFTGSVTEAPCSIPAGEASQNVDLGTLSNKQLTSSKPGSPPVQVKITLKNCDLGSTPKYSKASLKFLDDGNLSSTAKNKGFLSTSGSKDVSVQLLDRTGAHPIDFTSDATMKPGTEVSLSDGADSTIIFLAHLMGTASDAPPAGDVKAQVSYQLSYY